MATFDWQDSFSVGIESVDLQHKKLVAALNTLHDAMLNRKANEIVAGIIRGMTEYVGVHFAYEEELMVKYNYPDYPEHKEAHEAFIEKVGKFSQDLWAGKVMLSMDVFNFLKDWLKTHILDMDKKFGPFLVEKGVT